MSGLPLLLTRAEAAEALRIPPEGIDRLTADGRLHPVQLLADRPPMYRPRELLELIDAPLAYPEGTSLV